jgi:hypothetical protein
MKMRYKVSDIVEYDPLPKVREPPDIIPQILISPFSYQNMGPGKDELEPELMDGFTKGKKWRLLPRASAGISLLKELIGMENVSVFTTFGTHYISGCILDAFEGVRISRKFTPSSDALFVIHEWGIEHPDLQDLKEVSLENDIPLIEDCALTMRSDIGITGDYILHSFPKVLPMQFGGMISGDLPDDLDRRFPQFLSQGRKRELILSQLTCHIGSLHENFARRIENWNYLDGIFETAGLGSFFDLGPRDVPYIYMLRTKKSEELSNILSDFGIEAGVYWKNDGLFLPCHQNLGNYQLDYIAGVVLDKIEGCSENRQ